MPDPGGGGAGDARFALIVCVKTTLRPGAGMRARSARPYGVDAAFGAPGSWPGPVWRAKVVAPYEIARQFTFSRPTGWQSFRFP